MTGRTIGTVPVVLSSRVEAVGGWYTTDGPVFFMHPADWYALEYPGQPHAILDAVIGWHLDKTMRRLDALGERL